jgi:mono/diheme cytochrome c family protein
MLNIPNMLTSNMLTTFSKSVKVSTLVIAGWLAVGTAAHAQAPGSQAAPASGANAKRGEQLFTTDGCYQCHNYQGQGGGAGARLAPNPMPLTAFSSYVRNPKGQMPPYTAKVLPDADLADIHAYLQSIPKGQSAKNIPLLNEH